MRRMRHLTSKICAVPVKMALRVLVLAGLLSVALAPWGPLGFSESLVLAQESGVDLQFNPSSSPVGPGDTFTVDIEVAAGNQALDTVSGFADFDPAQLQVLSIGGGPTLPVGLRQTFDNTTGYFI